jgi:hypothetical protein
LSHVTIGVVPTSYRDAARFWTNVMGFEPSPSTSTPFGLSTALMLNHWAGVSSASADYSSMTVLLVESGSGCSLVRPPPPNHTSIRGLSQFSFRVRSKDVVAAWAKQHGLPILFEYRNDQLGLYLQFIRDPTTAVLIEFLQPLASDPAVVPPQTWGDNLLGFSQITSSVSNVLNTSAWYERALGTVLPFNFYLDLLSKFGTQLGISVLGWARFEHIYQVSALHLVYVHPSVSVGLSIVARTKTILNVRGVC